MNPKIVHHRLLQLVAVVLAGITLLPSCTKFLENGTPPSSLTEDKSFKDSSTATSAILALYSRPANDNPQNNCLVFNLTRYGGMSADELYYPANSTYDVFKDNTLAAGNSANSLWFDGYTNIGRANYAIQNLSSPIATLPETVRTKLLGEAKFWRAWQYFYLVNYFGEVPLVTNTDALTNSLLPKTTVAKVYDQIVADLADAKNLVSTTYPTADRARVNKKVVAALQARVYFYLQNWTAAEAAATEVISTADYKIETDLNNVFIKTSNEVILQLANTTGVTSWGGEFITAAGATPTVVLYDTLANTFELNDKRKANWAKSIVYGAKTYYYPYKYKFKSGTAGNEYHVVLRLAEMHLIRAEARAHNNLITDAQDDLNKIRERAGLLKTTAATPTDLYTALEHERWVELFTEFSDRWFNLKRTNKADVVLSLIKPKWQPFQKLYPIPQTEREANTNLLDNTGYTK
jgi:hypothetical protein